MKKLLLLTLGLSLFFGIQVNAANFTTEVLPWLNSSGLTKYSTAEGFRGDDSIQRGEASKFVDKFAQTMKLEHSYTECDFSDIEGYDYSLIPHIAQACAFGLLKGSQGTFNPTGNLTEAQGLTLVMRSLYGFQDETVNPWYKNYYELADKAGLITGETIDTVDGINITRQKLGTWFYQAAHSDTDITTDTETDTDTTTDTTIDTDTNTTTDTTTDTDTVSDTDTVDDTDNAQGPFQLTHEEIVYSSRFLLIEGENGEYFPKVTNITQGERILIEARDIDAQYGTEFPESLNPKISESGLFVIIDTSTPGEYEFTCTTNCGDSDMLGIIDIEPVDQSNVESRILTNGTKHISVQGNNGAYTPMVIVVHQDEDVKLEILKGDKSYGLMFDTLTTSTDVAGNISLDTSTPGVYTFQCETNCQSVNMMGKLIVAKKE